MQSIAEHWPLILFLILVVFGILAFRQSSKPVALPYEPAGPLFTAAELRFYAVLCEAVEEDWEIFGKVRIADLLKVKSETQQRITWQNKINCKHIDFVLCDPETLEPVAAIELDDRSHHRADRVARDQFVNAAFKSAGLPLLRVPVRKSYDSGEIRSAIETCCRNTSQAAA